MSKIPLLPKTLDEPGPPPVPMKTLSRWALFIGSVAAGEGLPESKAKHYMTNADIEAVTRDDPAERQRFNDAVIAGRKRVWSILQYQEFFGYVAEGKTLEQAQLATVGSYNPRLSELINADPDLHTQYMRALEARSHVVLEPIIETIQDRSRDTLDTLKGPIPNMAAVSRDKLIVDSRFRLAGIYNKKDYGEQKVAPVNVQIINHAEVLEAARTRDKLRDKSVTPAQMQAAIDATFSEKPVDNDTSWMDEQPADAQWREEK